MHKLLTYGCSFTRYDWSTWADIIGLTFPDHINYGKPGAGNHYIFNHIMQSIAKQEISKEDTVIVCWTSVDREDRFVKDNWMCGGQIGNNTNYNKNFMDNYFDPVGCYIRDLAFIASTYHALRDIGCEFRFISMTKLNLSQNSFFGPMGKIMFNNKITDAQSKIQNSIHAKESYKQFKNYVDFVGPNFLETIYNGEWMNRKNDCFCIGVRPDWYTEKAGDGWPSVDSLLDRCWDHFDSYMLGELLEMSSMPSIERLDRERPWADYDFHPTPLMHLEYVQKVFTEYRLSEDIIERITDENSTLSKQFAEQCKRSLSAST